MDGFAVERDELLRLRLQIEAALKALLPEPNEACTRLSEAMRYALLSPGKRVRPLLTLLAAEHLGCPARRALHGACALEMVHAASLVLDDLPCMDDAETRRGQPSLHRQFGQDIAVLTGVALLNEAFNVIAEAPGVGDAARIRMIGLLTRTVGPRGLVSGQVRDLAGVAGLDRDGYSAMHHEKTGVLFIAAVEMGAVAADADEGTLKTLRIFAQELGLAFQALDDLADARELENGQSRANILSALSVEEVQREVERRVNRAKTALRQASGLAPIGDYLDLLIGRGAGR